MSLTKVSAGVLNIDDLFGFRNRIINGDMRIDQRNAGASVTIVSASAQFALDRFQTLVNTAQATTCAIQQVTDAPTGFVNSYKFTTGTGAAATSSQQARFYQSIEGFNVADLDWGTAGAKTVTLSFSVKSSQSGTFGGSIRNEDGTRSYPFTYTISVADTWEYKTVEIDGDTTGTWLKSNNLGILVLFDLGNGSNFLGTAGAWAAANYLGATGGTSTVAVTGATWQITGVQLEVGSVATPFERRPFGTELSLCQRYYFRHKAPDGNAVLGNGFILDTNTGLFVRYFPVTMRTAPSAIEQSGTAADYRIRYSNTNTNCNGVPTFSTSSDNECTFTATVASGTTNGQGAFFRSTNSSAFLAWSAEL